MQEQLSGRGRCPQKAAPAQSGWEGTREEESSSSSGVTLLPLRRLSPPLRQPDSSFNSFTSVMTVWGRRNVWRTRESPNPALTWPGWAEPLRGGGPPLASEG